MLLVTIGLVFVVIIPAKLVQASGVPLPRHLPPALVLALLQLVQPVYPGHRQRSWTARIVGAVLVGGLSFLFIGALD